MGAHNRGKGKARQWLLDHVDYHGDECLIWPFSKGPWYGQFGHESKTYYAHRYMCELINGPPPTPAHEASHSCGNGRKACVHPKHLSWKTHSGNQLDRRAHGTTATGIPKFTPEMDSQIKEMRKTMTLMEIAKIFGVTHSTIQYRLYGGSHLARRRRLGVVRVSA